MIRKLSCADTFVYKRESNTMQQVIINLCLFCMVIDINGDNSHSIIHSVSIRKKENNQSALYMQRLFSFFLYYINLEFIDQSIYFSAGIFSNSCTKKSHHLGTEAISVFSSGECAFRIVGPMEIISNSGYFSTKRPHSNPA